MSLKIKNALSEYTLGYFEAKPFDERWKGEYTGILDLIDEFQDYPSTKAYWDSMRQQWARQGMYSTHHLIFFFIHINL